MNDKELITSDQKLLQVNPDVSRDEQLDFINTYRNLQAADTDEINRQTHAQGSDLPSFKGGLTGVGGYLATRYQQPQTEARVATLRSAAQQAALNQALKNIQENMQEQYNKAYRDYSNAAAKKKADDSDTEKKNTVETDTGEGSGTTSDLNVNQNTKASDLKNVLNDDGSVSQKMTLLDHEEHTLVPADTAFMNVAQEGMKMGVWPNGSKLNLNSTYKWGGNTYTYIAPTNAPSGIYKITDADNGRGGR